ncbi:MAG: hypothetical protein JWQ77_3104 [Jatrophihabitans sp.]|nr:hypothetical protein [Jatrophihabitans sp.]
MSGRTSRRYPVELRERAVRMVTEVGVIMIRSGLRLARSRSCSGSARPRRCASGASRLRSTPAHGPPSRGRTRAELKRLKRENAELSRANGAAEILPAGGELVRAVRAGKEDEGPCRAHCRRPLLPPCALCRPQATVARGEAENGT